MNVYRQLRTSGDQFVDNQGDIVWRLKASTAAEVVPRSSVFSLIRAGWSGRASDHQKLFPTILGIDGCLIVTKPDFLEMEAITMTEHGIPKWKCR